MSLAETDYPPGAAASERRQIGPVAVAALTQAEALARLHKACDSRAGLRVAFANAHLINLAVDAPEYSRLLSGFLVLPDGIGVELGSRLLHGEAFPANLNGTDFTPLLLASAPRALTVALVGARPGVAEKAARALAALDPRHRIEAFSDGYFDAADEARLLDRLERERPDVLLVAFGNPLQERWIASRIDGRHCAVALGVGALFDFLAGETKRAPAWVRAARLEWLWRLGLEPGRLWRRYVLGNPLFLARMLKARLKGGAS